MLKQPRSTEILLQLKATENAMRAKLPVDSDLAMFIITRAGERRIQTISCDDRDVFACAILSNEETPPMVLCAAEAAQFLFRVVPRNQGEPGVIVGFGAGR